MIAAGADYRFGLGPATERMLDWGIARWPLIAQILSWRWLRDWFYYTARRATGGRFRRLAQPGQKVTVIGDAARAGKSKQAIASAFEAALLVRVMEMDNRQDRGK